MTQADVVRYVRTHEAGSYYRGQLPTSDDVAAGLGCTVNGAQVLLLYAYRNGRLSRTRTRDDGGRYHYETTAHGRQYLDYLDGAARNQAAER